MPKSPTKPPVDLVAKDIDHAPIIFFDSAPTFSAGDGIIGASLACGRALSCADGTIEHDILIAAYLRCTVSGAKQLREALDRALLAIAKSNGTRTN